MGWLAFGITVIVFVLLVKLIQYGAKSALKGVESYEERQKQKYNPYINRHKTLKVDNDMHYDKYLEWCYANDEIPTSKEIFLKEVEQKEKEFEKLISGI